MEPGGAVARPTAMRWLWIPALVLAAGCGGAPSEAPERTTVPQIRYGTSVADALRILEEAGLRGHEPDVDWPHYVTGTDPAAGTVVDVGTRVELEIGDG